MAKFGSRNDSQSGWEVLVMWYSSAKSSIYLSVVPVQNYWGHVNYDDIKVRTDIRDHYIDIIFEYPTEMYFANPLEEEFSMTTNRSSASGRGKLSTKILNCDVVIREDKYELWISFDLDEDEGSVFDFDESDIKWFSGESSFQSIIKIVEE